ncbi:hypothetical protein ACHAWF_001131, partial [Thalassiosira exigua]
RRGEVVEQTRLGEQAQVHGAGSEGGAASRRGGGEGRAGGGGADGCAGGRAGRRADRRRRNAVALAPSVEGKGADSEGNVVQAEVARGGDVQPGRFLRRGGHGSERVEAAQASFEAVARGCKGRGRRDGNVPVPREEDERDARGSDEPEREAFPALADEKPGRE